MLVLSHSSFQKRCFQHCFSAEAFWVYCFVHFGCTRIQKRVRYMSSATLSLCLAAPRLLFVRREWEVASLEDQLATIHGVALEACICLLLSRRMCKIMWGAMLTAIRNHLVGEYVRKQPVQLDMSSVLLSPPIPPHDFTLVVFFNTFYVWRPHSSGCPDAPHSGGADVPARAGSTFGFAALATGSPMSCFVASCSIT